MSFMRLQRLYVRAVEVYRQKFSRFLRESLVDATTTLDVMACYLMTAFLPLTR